jgi:hypothetical protein
LTVALALDLPSLLEPLLLVAVVVTFALVPDLEELPDDE